MTFLSELARLREDKSGYAEFDDIALSEFLVNHSGAIEELVRASEWVDKRFYRADRDVIVINDLHKALEKLNRSE